VAAAEDLHRQAAVDLKLESGLASAPGQATRPVASESIFAKWAGSIASGELDSVSAKLQSARSEAHV